MVKTNLEKLTTLKKGQFQESEPNKEGIKRETKDCNFFIREVTKSQYDVLNSCGARLNDPTTLQKCVEFINQFYQLSRK
jgi:hypothetical protein